MPGCKSCNRRKTFLPPQFGSNVQQPVQKNNLPIPKSNVPAAVVKSDPPPTTMGERVAAKSEKIRYKK